MPPTNISTVIAIINALVPDPLRIMDVATFLDWLQSHGYSISPQDAAYLQKNHDGLIVLIPFASDHVTTSVPALGHSLATKDMQVRHHVTYELQRHGYRSGVSISVGIPNAPGGWRAQLYT